MSLQQQFDFNKEYILENDRVLLRPLCIADLALLQNYVETEPEIWTYSLVAIRDVKDVGAYIETAIKARKEQNSYTFIVYDKMLKTYVGCTRFYDIQLSFETTQLGYTWYSKKVWGTGINTHCKFLLLQFAFENIGFKRVEFRADNDNKRSIAAMQKIGCTIEGVLRSHLPKPDGTRRDSIVLSILQIEWQEKVKEKIKNLL